MNNSLIEGRSINQWVETYPLLKDIMNSKEVYWSNNEYGMKTTEDTLTSEDVKDASNRLERFAPFIAKVFPETRGMNGIIESDLITIPKMQETIEEKYNVKLSNKFLMKCDSHLPISGSIKARGGIYEVLKHAEDLALKYELITSDSDYSKFDSPGFREFFSNYSIAVGSTGNLGLSIGIMGAQLGFKVTVHMSAEAKQWKKVLLRSKGVVVIEHNSDYSVAVEEGRKMATTDPYCYFIDDENSSDLFLGYSVAASRLKKQLEALKVTVDESHPLFVYLPCGVGGGPGGITFGLKAEFGENVHCIFAEPTNSPCFLIGQLTGLYDKVSVQDFGLSNQTEADGLAVGRASQFVGRTIGHLLSGCYTIEDARLYSLFADLVKTENIYLEPSALAGFYGPVQLLSQPSGRDYFKKFDLEKKLNNAHHLVWATGGSMVPPAIMKEYSLNV
jgi:D-serine dehydratase